jgi:hypothetical protein
LTGEALALLYLGCWLEESALTRRWRETGWQILCEQLERQVHPDGAYFEQTTWYQRYTVDFYLHALLLAEEAGLVAPTGFKERIELAVDVLLHVMRPDGSTPLIGDDDGGQLLELGVAELDDFRDTLALAGVVLDRPDYRYGAGAPRPSLVWLLGLAGLERFESHPRAAPAALCRAFADGGYYCLRDGWSADSSHMVIDAGRHGGITGGHAHADALSFELTIEGAPLLVDPGTVSYVGPERERFRSTAVHNTATIDGVSSSEPAGTFRWSRWANTTVDTWFTRDWATGLAARCDGYVRLPDPVLHQRTVLLLPDTYWLVVDRFCATGTHQIRIRFQAAAGVTGDGAEPGRIALSAPSGSGGRVAAALWIAGSVQTVIREGLVSRGYGRCEQAVAVDAQLESAGPAAVLALLAPARRLEGATLTGGAVQGGWHWRITCNGLTDTVAVSREGEVVEVDGLRITSGLGWLRRDRTGSPVALIGFGPQPVAIDGLLLRPRGNSVLTCWRDGLPRTDE